MKYKNRETVVDGITFDSKLEARRYCELRLMERAGEITQLCLQPAYQIIPQFSKNGKTYRRTVYKADFRYFDVRECKYIIEDTKGLKTPVYALKKKLFEYQYPELEIKEVYRA